MTDASILDQLADLDGERFLLALERSGFVSRGALFDLGTTAEPNIVDAQDWVGVVALNHSARIAPKATAGDTALFTLEVGALDARAFDRIAVLRKAGWQVKALPTSRSILLVLVPS